MIRKGLMGVVIVGVLAGIAVSGPWLVQQVTPHQIGTLNTWVDQIWWPFTALRGGVYVLLAWTLYPLWVQRHIRQAETVQARRARDDPPYTDRERASAEAYRRHLSRAGQRSPWVFGAFLISDLVLAQFPYGLLR